MNNMECELNRAKLLAALKECMNSSSRTKRDKRAINIVVSLHRKAQIIRVEQELPVGNILLNLYSRFGDMTEAQRIFDNITNRNVVSWTALIQGYAENGQVLRALQIFNTMDCLPNRVTCLIAVKACTSLATQKVFDKKTCLQTGVALHERIIQLGQDKDTSVSNALAGMYSKFGSISIARKVFDGIVQRDVVSWNTLILGYVDNQECELALEVFENMDCTPNSITFLAGIKACAALASKKHPDRRFCLDIGIKIHLRARDFRVESDASVANSLVDMYCKCGDMTRAREIFNKIVRLGDVVSWNTIIQGCAENGDFCSALEMFESMNCAPNKITFLAALKACVTLENALRVHRRASECGADNELFVANSLVTIYSRCKSMKHAKEVFDGIQRKDGISWSSLVLGYVENCECQTALKVYSNMDCTPNTVALAAAGRAYIHLASRDELDKVTCLQKATELHRQALDLGHDKDIYVRNTLMEMYIRSGSLSHARDIFNSMEQQIVSSCNILLLGYLENSEALLALDLFDNMTVTPNTITLVAVSKACTYLAAGDCLERKNCLEIGLKIHRRCIVCDITNNIYAASSLVDMYSKLGEMVLAQLVFDSLVETDVVLWSALIHGYVENQDSIHALKLFETMDCEPDNVAYLAALKACACLVDENKVDIVSCQEKGMSIHEQAKACGFDKDLNVSNMLVAMYSKFGETIKAKNVFDAIEHRSVVSWNALIDGYVDNKDYTEALRMFEAIDSEPTRVTLIAALKACGGLAAENELERIACIEKGRKIHERIREQGLEQDIAVASALLDMYSKCQNMEQAQSVFDNMVMRDAICWTTLILGYVRNEQSSKALKVFSSIDVRPDAVAFVSALKACASLGALEAGKQIHDQICEHELEQDQMVASCLLDFYGKCGDMSAAEGVFARMHIHDTVAWGALLGGYSKAGNSCQVLKIVKRMQELGVKMNSVTFLLVLTACSHAGMVEEGKTYFDSMQGYGISPNAEHYACMIDMMGRANKMREALVLALAAPFENDTQVWITLLASCKECCDLEVGNIAFNELTKEKHKNYKAKYLQA